MNPPTEAEIYQARWRVRRGLSFRVGDPCPICVQTGSTEVGRVQRTPGKPMVGTCSLRAYHYTDLDELD